jgi:hypothetical protein
MSPWHVNRVTFADSIQRASCSARLSFKVCFHLFVHSVDKSDPTKLWIDKIDCLGRMIA